jgi:hypothetical protein
MMTIEIQDSNTRLCDIQWMNKQQEQCIEGK